MRFLPLLSKLLLEGGDVVAMILMVVIIRGGDKR